MLWERYQGPTELLDRFDADMFVYAAGWMRAPVANCLVVEDSVPGVRAARAAGMRVLGRRMVRRVAIFSPRHARPR